MTLLVALVNWAWPYILNSMIKETWNVETDEEVNVATLETRRAHDTSSLPYR